MRLSQLRTNMKKPLYKQKKILIIVLILVIIGTLAYDLISAHNKKAAKAPDSTATSPSTPDQTAPGTSTPQTAAPKNIDYSRLELPVLMYHHIRDYNFEKDTIGTSLSVPPEKFRNQLDLIAESGYGTTTFQDINNGTSSEKPIVITFDDGYSNFYDNAFPELKKRKMTAVVYIISDFVGKDGYMTSDQIKEISSYGIEIGAHTKTHPDLTIISNEKAREEIFGSKSALEQIIGKGIISFCYPSGKYNQETESLVKEAGYTFATTTTSGITTFSDPLALKRDRMNNDTNISGFLK